MAHLNIYVPDSLEKRIRTQAHKKGKKVSSYLTELVEERIHPKAWNKDFFTKIVGGWKGDFPEIERPLPEERKFS